MEHYTANATVGVRLIALAFFFLGLMGVPYLLFRLLLERADELSSADFWYSGSSCFMYMLTGVSLYFLSKSFGRLIGRGLREQRSGLK